MRLRLMLFATSVVALAGVSHVSAQARLTGSFVRNVSIGTDGTMICTGGACGAAGESMIYGEAVTDPGTCDLYVPGSPQESFTVEATPMGLPAVVLTNNGDMFAGPDEWTTLSGPTVAGRAIVWSGRAMGAGYNIRVDQRHELGAMDRHVRLEVTVTNEGTLPLSDVFYLRNGDPDHGQCSIGTIYDTNNDVVRQPPADSSAFATSLAGDGAGPGRRVALGVGAFDPRARVHTGGFANSDASGEWMAPVDAGGALLDEAVDLIFREAALAPGASATFVMYYVWGPDVPTVTARFDALSACVGAPDGTACMAGGGPGMCRGGSCCGGCWDGMACQTGDTVSACGAGGGMCAGCDDMNECTDDACTAGACGNSNSAAGTTCDDGAFCTMGDACDGAGACMAGAMPACDDGLACTTDACDEATDMCSATIDSGCVIGGGCVAMGDPNPGNACETCDPTASAMAWSPAPMGTSCGASMCDMGNLTEQQCDAMGACGAVPSTCPTGMCADATACVPVCTPGSCAAGEFCDTMTGVCTSTLPAGMACTDAAMCATGVCADGRCCDRACDGTCEACNMAGECTPHAAGSDPEDECPAECDGASACEMPTLPDAGVSDDAGIANDGAVGNDGAVASDGGVNPDGGTTTTDGGCGCRATGAPSRSHGFWALLALGALLGWRRRRSRARA